MTDLILLFTALWKIVWNFLSVLLFFAALIAAVIVVAWAVSVFDVAWARGETQSAKVLQSGQKRTGTGQDEFQDRGASAVARRA